jgi:hypothetical protein
MDNVIEGTGFSLAFPVVVVAADALVLPEAVLVVMVEGIL